MTWPIPLTGRSTQTVAWQGLTLTVHRASRGWRWLLHRGRELLAMGDAPSRSAARLRCSLVARALGGS